MNRGLRRVAMGMTVSFVLLSFGLIYWQFIKAQTLLENPANRRLVLMEEKVTRGGIFDHNGEVLAQTQVSGNQKLRAYPKGEMFAPLLGYATLKYGSAGLESSLADWLLGMKNATPAQQLARVFGLQRQGDDVVLTVDSRVQQAAYEAMQGKTGAAVAIDPRDGSVLAMVSTPSFDPNQINQKWNEILAMPGSPLRNHAFSLFPPGSTMKVVTAASLLRSGVNTTDLYQCTGSTIINGQVITEQNGRSHGWVNFNQALADSCNTYFAHFGVQSGDQHFLQAAKGFGFGLKIPFELTVPESTITNAVAVPDHLDTNLLAASCFGQGQVLVTPMHMALIAAGIANKGVIMTPHLVDQVLDDKQDIVYKTEIKPWITPLSQDEAAKITSAMITAVNQGTAAPGALPDVQVAGKTGSAEPGGNEESHGWYIAFAPADNPVVAVAVLVEHGGTGGGSAAPVAQAMIKQVLSGK